MARCCRGIHGPGIVGAEDLGVSLGKSGYGGDEGIVAQVGVAVHVCGVSACGRSLGGAGLVGRWSAWGFRWALMGWVRRLAVGWR